MIATLDRGYLTNSDNLVNETILEDLNYCYPSRGIYIEDNDIINPTFC